jgi:O-antigen/teichoic acid export membrane protein
MKHLNENLTHKFVKRGSWLYLFAFLTGPIGYAIKIIISHDLSVPELGILYGVLSFILLIGSLNDLGMVESLKFFVPKFLGENNLKKAKAFFVYGGTAMLVMSLFTSLVLYSAANWLSEVYFRAPEAAMILQVFSIYLLISNIQHYFSAVFLIFQNTKFSQGLEVIRLAVSLGFAAQAFFVGHGNLEFYTGIWNYGTLVASIIGGWFVWKLHLKELFLQVPFEFSRDDFGELFTYSTWALLASNATFILSQVDMQMLLLMKGPSETGIYSNYLSLIAIPFIVLTPIIGFIFPVASSYFGANQPEKIRTIATVFSRIFVLL